MIVGGLVAWSQTGTLSTTVKEVGISTMVGGVIIGVVGLTRTAGLIAGVLVIIVSASCFLVAADAAFDFMYEGPARHYLGPRITFFGAFSGSRLRHRSARRVVRGEEGERRDNSGAAASRLSAVEPATFWVIP
jgi:hypothetical protein